MKMILIFSLSLQYGRLAHVAKFEIILVQILKQLREQNVYRIYKKKINGIYVTNN